MSPKATPLMALFWFGLLMVNVSVDVPLGRIGLGANCLVIDGGRTAVSVALAMLLVFVPPSDVERKPLTFECGPAVVAVTLTLTVQKGTQEKKFALSSR